MSKDSDLDRAAKIYCGQICNRQLVHLRKIKIRKHNVSNEYEIWDFPAMVAACKSDFNNSIYTDHAKGVKKEHVQTILRVALEKIGEIGEKSYLCGNIIGRCAEQHAANKLLKDQNLVSLTRIKFSKAYRPKTLQVYDYCENCKAVFPQLKRK